MITILDEVAADIRRVLPDVRVVVDPAQVVPPCVFVGLPTVVAATLAGHTLEVPVHLVAPAPGDARAALFLLKHLPRLLVGTGTENAFPSIVDIDDDRRFPAYTVTVTYTTEDDLGD